MNDTSAPDNLPIVAEPVDPPKRPGRPKGLPKTGGRKKGVANKDRSATIDRIMRMADPIEFLCKVCRGDRMEAADEVKGKKRTFWYPSGDQRITAAQALAKKVMPDIKAVEHSGPIGAPMTVRINLQPPDDA